MGKAIVIVFLVLMSFASAALGGYVGIWLCLVGGIATLVEQYNSGAGDGLVIAWAIVRLTFFELPLAIGIYSAFACAFGVVAAIMEWK
jgi:lipopolysaccharide export LptBFGC system permease protein LptF